MTSRPSSHRPRLSPRAAAVAAGLVAAGLAGAGILGACNGSNPATSPPPSGSSQVSSPPSSPASSPEPSLESPAPTPSPSSAPSLPTQSESSIGRIWDALPPSYPLPAGAEPTEIREPEDPASGVFAVPGRPVEVAAALRAALEAAGFTTAATSGPFEDGSYVIESTGAGGCRARSTVRPMGELTVLLVRYGAACPFE
jgi:hypothetical protein